MLTEPFLGDLRAGDFAFDDPLVLLAVSDLLPPEVARATPIKMRNRINEAAAIATTALSWTQSIIIVLFGVE